MPNLLRSRLIKGHFFQKIEEIQVPKIKHVEPMINDSRGKYLLIQIYIYTDNIVYFCFVCLFGYAHNTVLSLFATSASVLFDIHVLAFSDSII